MTKEAKNETAQAGQMPGADGAEAWGHYEDGMRRAEADFSSYRALARRLRKHAEDTGSFGPLRARFLSCAADVLDEQATYVGEPPHGSSRLERRHGHTRIDGAVTDAYSAADSVGNAPESQEKKT